MKSKKITFEETLVNLILPYILQPEQGTAEFIIIQILNEIKEEFSYSCNNCLDQMDEFYGRMYGAERIDTDNLELIINNLEIMRQSKKEEEE